MRLLSRLLLAAWLCLAGSASAYMLSYAQSDTPAADNPPGDQPPEPAGPTLHVTDYTPVICDPAASGFRFVEVRGTGFDAWATQRLVGNVVDSNGSSRVQWGSVWVSPAGNLTLEVNLCADPFRNRPALPAGDYTVVVGSGTGRAIAATGLALVPPPDASAEGDQSAPDALQAPTIAASPTPVFTPFPYVIPNIRPQPTPTPLPPAALPNGTTSAPALVSSPTPGPATGPGSLSQPLPLGAPGNLDDGWQLG